MNNKQNEKNAVGISIKINDLKLESHQTTLESLSSELWAEYKQILANDHRPLFNLLNHYINQREQSFKTVPLTIKLPCYLARIFKIEDSHIIRAATLGTCFLDHYTQLLDDITDLKVTTNPEMIHASNEMLIEGMAILCSCLVNNNEIGFKIKGYILEAMESERQLWPTNIRIGLYENTEYTALSKRGGIIRSAAAVYSYSSGMLDILNKIENCLLNISQAIQLLDDIIDWQEDFLQKRVTSIINLGHINIGKYESDDIIFNNLLENDAFQTNIQRALNLLNEVENEFSLYNPIELLSVIKSIKVSAQFAKDLFTHVYKIPKGERKLFIQKKFKSNIAINMMH